jgi:hypothetical protein
VRRSLRLTRDPALAGEGSGANLSPGVAVPFSSRVGGFQPGFRGVFGRFSEGPESAQSLASARLTHWKDMGMSSPSQRYALFPRSRFTLTH